MAANGQNGENLRELFGKFFGADESEEATEDIRKGERILDEHGAPEPDSELLADVKAEISRALLVRKSNAFRRGFYKTAAVAAVVIIAAVISVKLSDRGTSERREIATASVIPAAIWESDDIAVDDAELGTFVGEIEELEGDVLALELGENGGNGYEAIEELEVELEEIEGVFWKG
ncbi:MAG: hypothetical protein JSV99_12185 [Planctomycetota bacterium]|nr:MAG: hypothetical protein JSV99_12185 [Planctomycetota bacterium]